MNISKAVAITSAVALVAALAASANAKDLKESGRSCYAGEVTSQISFSDTHVAGIAYSRGSVMFDSPPNQLNSNHCMGEWSVIDGQFTLSGACESIDQDGDKAFLTYKTGTYTYLAGTGKYEGIKGGGTVTPVAQFPELDQGKFNGCDDFEGSYTLPD